MVLNVICINCGECLGDKYLIFFDLLYKKLKEKGLESLNDNRDILVDKMGIQNKCCRTHLVCASPDKNLKHYLNEKYNYSFDFIN